MEEEDVEEEEAEEEGEKQEFDRILYMGCGFQFHSRCLLIAILTSAVF